MRVAQQQQAGGCPHLLWNDSKTASIVECVGPHAVIRIDADNVHSLDRQDTGASMVQPLTRWMESSGPSMVQP
jgi:hypothetical protein